MKADFEKAGLLTVREGHVLLCRKKHTASKLYNLLSRSTDLFLPFRSFKNDCGLLFLEVNLSILV